MGGGTQNPQNLFIKYCVFILRCLNFSHLIQYKDLFSTLVNSFWTRWFWRLLVLLPFFVSPLPHCKTFPFEDFFHPGGKKKVIQGKISWIGRVGQWGHTVFGQKWKIQHGVGRCTRKSTIRKWANMLSLQKKIHWTRMQLLTTLPVGTLIQMSS